MAVYDRYPVVPNEGESPFWGKTFFKVGQTDFAGTDSLKIWTRKTPEGRPNIWSIQSICITTTTDATVADRIPVIKAFDLDANTQYQITGKAIPASQTLYTTALAPIGYMNEITAGSDWGSVIPDGLLVENLLWVYLSNGQAGDGFYVYIQLKYQNYRLGMGKKELEAIKTIPIPVRPPEFVFPPARFD